MFDLSELYGDQLDRVLEEHSKIDQSGRPKPVNVRVQLNSGIEVRCDVRYSGINKQDGDRLFTVVAEIDWENYHPVALLVEEMCNDVEFRFRIPGMSDFDAQQICRTMQLRPDRIIGVK